MINPIDKKIFLNSHQEIINIGKKICDNLQDHRFAKNFYINFIHISRFAYSSEYAKFCYTRYYIHLTVQKKIAKFSKFKNLRRNLKYICKILHNNALLYYNTHMN